MDELQKTIDAQIGKNAGADKNSFNRNQLEDIILTPEETSLKNKTESASANPQKIPGTRTLDALEGDLEGVVFAKSLEVGPSAIKNADGKEKNEQPKTIADLLKIEADVAKNPPRAPLSLQAQNKLKENLKNIDYYPHPESPIVKRLRTLRGDVQEAMQSGKTTLVSIASAEVSRQSEQKQKIEMRTKALNESAPAKTKSSKSVIIVASIVSILLIGGGAAAIYFFQDQALRPVTVIKAPSATAFIPIQFETKISTENRNASYLRSAIAAERVSKSGNLNDMGAIYLSRADAASVTGERSLSTQEFFNTFEMRAPEELTRTLSPEFMLGIHRFPDSPTFLIFKTDSYESAVAGTLSWERNLEDDTGKLLRNPSDFAYTTSSEAQTNQRVFKDAVIKNNDVRAIYNDKNELLFFYTFLKDRQTLIMATTPGTLGEIITGLSAKKLQR